MHFFLANSSFLHTLSIHLYIHNRLNKSYECQKIKLHFVFWKQYCTSYFMINGEKKQKYSSVYKWETHKSFIDYTLWLSHNMKSLTAQNWVSSFVYSFCWINSDFTIEQCAKISIVSALSSPFFLSGSKKKKRHKNVSHPSEIFFVAPRGILHPGVRRIKTMSFPKRDFHVDESFSLFVHFCYNWNRSERRKETTLSFSLKISKFYFLENLLAQSCLWSLHMMEFDGRV